MSTGGTVVVVVIAVIAVAAVVIAVVAARRRVANERRVAADAQQRAAAAADELARERAEMAAGLAAAHAERDAADTARRQAADAAEAARRDAEAAVAAQQAADAAAAAAEQRAADLAGVLAQTTRRGVDADLLWDLERARSERTWRHSVAVDPHDSSVFVDASDPLRVALQVEMEAAREDVGAVVVLDVDVPAGMRAAGSLLTLRVAQELLAEAVRRGEETTLHVRPDGTDLLVAVSSVDADGAPVELPPLSTKAGADAVVEEAGVRILGALAAVPPAE